MIGIHYRGKVYWFDFPHTLESQEMLLRRLEREAKSRAPSIDRINESMEQAREGFKKMQQAINAATQSFTDAAQKMACRSKL